MFIFYRDVFRFSASSSELITILLKTKRASLSLVYCQSLSAPRKTDINRFRIETDFDDSWRFYVFINQAKDNWKMCKVLKHTKRTLVLRLYSIHFEINGNPCNLIGSHWYDLFTNLIFSCIFYPTSKEALLKYNNEQI